MPSDFIVSFFLNALSKETIQNYVSAVFDLLYPVGYKLYPVGMHCICELLLLNYPIASRCTDFVFQKRYELEVIYLIVFVIGEGRFSKVSLAENNRERRTLRKESSTEVYQI